MHSSRLVIRQSCVARNAYSITYALSSTFSTATRLRQQDEALQQARSNGDRGSFASYEAIHEQLNSPEKRDPKQWEDRTMRPASHVPQRTGLRARQEIMERGLKIRTQQMRAPKASQSLIGPPTAAVEGHADSPVANDLQDLQDPAAAESKSESVKKHGVGDSKPLRDAALWTQITAERRDAKRSGGKTADGWKYVMHWIAKCANRVAKGDFAIDWNNEQEVSRMREMLSYVPKPLSPQQSPLPTPTPIHEPWALNKEDMPNKRAPDILDEEISRFAAWAALTPAELAARRAVATQTQSFISKNLYDHHMAIRSELFGSSATGLALATSDIDLRVYNTRPNQGEGGGTNNSKKGKDDRYARLGYPMRRLADRMARSEEYICVVFRWSKFPIINAQHRATGIDVQIVSSPSTAKQEAGTAKYLAELPHLRDLFSLARTMLGTRNLIDVFNGGVGSYGLFIMLVAALKRSQRSSQPPQTAGEQFRHFLDFYGTFQLERHGLAVEPTPKLFLKHDPSTISAEQQQSYIRAAHRRGDAVRAGQWAICSVRPLQQYLLCLQDPADPTNDVGRKSNGIMFLQATCRFLDTVVQERVERMDAVGEETVEGKRESLLSEVVGRVHEVLGERRARIEEFGRGVLEKGELEEAERRELEELRAEEAAVGKERGMEGGEKADSVVSVL